MVQFLNFIFELVLASMLLGFSAGVLQRFELVEYLVDIIVFLHHRRYNSATILFIRAKPMGCNDFSFDCSGRISRNKI